ncbi:MAG: excisionase family DNA-binding protein [Candidatus Omnitrophica bacterium]|nr:excisionase family DNA-binding protein [Candidatus Omnitrophota bacterium]MCA9416877.1 excisionase family DNA-binding protein [Candidatus Omnitrophota bacterium]MCA9424246.1 excisionase family DNA-binding protein [Candidatus Omnitrophota bacterium]MCA9431410.1 excisionase family DNA-binding protein [Candidatus Omnitrophota bacterium]MCA9436322.1 excisionase family DNA-binding protein [Candidatus Omnitrophota bacterium]
MLSQTLSPKELAQLIGASESSLKRWIDSGRIKAHKTSGGHRRISIAEAIAFIRDNNMLIERPDLLGLKTDPDLSGLPSTTDRSTILEKYLLDGHTEEAVSLCFSEYISGMSIGELCDTLIQPALKRIGCIWEHDRYGIVIEHRATDICLRIMNQLRFYLEPPTGPVVGIGGTPRGDVYLLPTLCAAVTLESEGVTVNNLGADVPFSSFLEAIERMNPSFVWLSLSHIDRVEDFRSEFEDFRFELESLSLPLILGGHALGKVEIPISPDIHIGKSMSDLVSIVRRIQGRPTNSTLTE